MLLVKGSLLATVAVASVVSTNKVLANESNKNDLNEGGQNKASQKTLVASQLKKGITIVFFHRQHRQLALLLSGLNVQKAF